MSSRARSWWFLLLSPRTRACCNREATALKRCRLENVPDVSAFLALMSVLQFPHQDACKGLEWILWRPCCYIQLHSVQTSCYARLAIGHLSHFYFRKNPCVMSPMTRCYVTNEEKKEPAAVAWTTKLTSCHLQRRRSQSFILSQHEVCVHVRQAKRIISSQLCFVWDTWLNSCRSFKQLRVDLELGNQFSLVWFTCFPWTCPRFTSCPGRLGMFVQFSLHINMLCCCYGNLLNELSYEPDDNKVPTKIVPWMHL